MSTKSSEPTLELKIFRRVLGNYYSAECNVRKELSIGHYYPKWFAYILIPAITCVLDSYACLTDDCKSRLLDYEEELIRNLDKAYHSYIAETAV